MPTLVPAMDFCSLSIDVGGERDVIRSDAIFPRGLI